MSTRNGATAERSTVKLVRCAIYTRKSTEEGLEQEFNTLDAQREAGEAFIASQRHDGWHALPDRYDDGGFTGGNTDRPALRRLLADVEAGRIDCVVVYKVDRLSRSLLDFTRLMEAFDKQRVSFVSVTQQFNTGSSMGRLVLNVLLSFAQFEREIIAERTRDKIAAMRRKGKWAGGLPPLGYDVDPTTSKLMVNADEAAVVRGIFALYREHGSLLPVVDELRDRGWANKRSRTKKGTERGGKPFDRTSLYRLLTNVAYVGQVAHKGEVHPGEHPPIIAPEVFTEVQNHLRRNGRTGGVVARNRFGALLKGLLRCTACDCAMTPTHTVKGDKRYRYYVCSAAQKNGRKTCPARSVPAGAVEQFVVDRIRCVGRDPALVRETAAAARAQAEARLDELGAERRTLERDLQAAHAEVRKLSARLTHDADGFALQRLAELQGRIARLDERAARVTDQEAEVRRGVSHPGEVAAALGQFDGVWASLTPKEQARLVALLVERVEYDGRTQTITLAFHPAGIQTLADQVEADQTQEVA
jgi:site-specific DNA recombinase